MKKLLLLAMVLVLLVFANFSLGGLPQFFLPLRDGKIYLINGHYTTITECGTYRKGEIYTLGRSSYYRWYYLYDPQGKELGSVKEEDIQEFENFYAAMGDDVRQIQKDKISDDKREREENARRQERYKEEERKKENILKEQAKKQAEERKKAAEVRKTRIAQFPIEVQNAINKRSVMIGMTPEQARLAWGNPERVNRTTTRWGVHEQWVYGSNYLYFEGDILTTIQN